ncbi:DUF6247 family protein [Nocardia sp. NBC_01503]|uniref:DUF6247 family protein n=1 Tax=Nocardia sp. NBC_01503 TaxID=2975997 RepID=UPI002E7B016A|nr:DUF6247 family protein [Nocardia sp. NBC_01503]WTL29527.1 DUF6247 family protein [Nocardia sp. NBC_01503]
MATPVPLPHPPQIPAADPEALRAVLPVALRDEFDAEWARVLDRAKQSHSLEEIYDLLNKWQHTAVMESRHPGSYLRLLEKAAQIEAAGGRTTAVSIEDMRTQIQRRLQTG